MPALLRPRPRPGQRPHPRLARRPRHDPRRTHHHLPRCRGGVPDPARCHRGRARNGPDARPAAQPSPAPSHPPAGGGHRARAGRPRLPGTRPHRRGGAAPARGPDGPHRTRHRPGRGRRPLPAAARGGRRRPPHRSGPPPRRPGLRRPPHRPGHRRPRRRGCHGGDQRSDHDHDHFNAPAGPHVPHRRGPDPGCPPGRRRRPAPRSHSPTHRRHPRAAAGGSAYTDQGLETYTPYYYQAGTELGSP
ncbi:hypothetical protein ACWEWX_32525, partial [Streptomyces asiaticus]